MEKFAHLYQQACTRMFVAALFAKAKDWKQMKEYTVTIAINLGKSRALYVVEKNQQTSYHLTQFL